MICSNACGSATGKIPGFKMDHWEFRLMKANKISCVAGVLGMESNSRSLVSDAFPASPNLSARQRPVSSSNPSPAAVLAAMKARQASKIKELGDALVSAGFMTLDDQAEALGLHRSTTWTILKGTHKASGLSPIIINRILAAPQLPPMARTKLLDYIREKSAGLYGGSRNQLRRFSSRLSTQHPEPEETAASAASELP